MRYLSIALLIAALGINIFFRMGPALLPATKFEAENTVIGDLIKEAKKQVDEKFKELPAQAKFKAIRDLLNIWKKERKESINEAIKNKQIESKSYWQDESGQTFLLEIDSYHWFNSINGLLTRGKINDAIFGNDQYAGLKLAPTGLKADPTLHKNLHVYLSYYLFKLARMFNKNIPLMPFLFYIPVFISSLALIAIFFFCSAIAKDKLNICGFFAAMALGLSPIFLRRSLAGWFDTDPYVILFSILSVWAVFCSLNDALPIKLRALFSLGGGLCIGLFSFTWFGWWYIFDLIIFSMLIYILNLYSLKKVLTEQIRISAPSFLLLLFILSSSISVWIFSGWEVFKNSFSEPITIAFAKGYLQNQFWPNVFLTVSELGAAGINDILRELGGGFLLFLSMVYWIVALSNKRAKDYKTIQFLSFLFSAWVSVTLFISLKAARFSLLLTVPLSVTFGIFLKYLIEIISNKISRFKKVPNVKFILLLAFSLIFIPLLFPNSILMRNSIPLMNRKWWEVLNKVKLQAPKDAVINSWWDFGHWFKAVAERKIIFDGSTQNTPMAYWMARFFLSTDEKEAIGILRMLNSGSNKAFEELEKLNIDRYKCLEILNEITLLTYKDADRALAKYVPQEKDRKGILTYTHNPKDAYVIIEPSLLYKISSISFIGRWDFKKALIYQKFKQLKKEGFIEYIIKEYNYNKEEAFRLYDTLLFLNTKDALFWISHQDNYYSRSSEFRKEDNLLLFNNSFVVDINKHYAYFNDVKAGKWKVPNKLFYTEGAALKEVDFEPEDEGLDFAVLLFQDKDDYSLVALDDRLANSMLIRLYYLGGAGLKSFNPVITEELKYDAGHITVYKVEWDKI